MTGRIFRRWLPALLLVILNGNAAPGADTWVPAPELKALADTTGLAAELAHHFQKHEIQRQQDRTMALMRCGAWVGMETLEDPDPDAMVEYLWVRGFMRKANLIKIMLGENLAEELAKTGQGMDEAIAMDPSSLVLVLSRASLAGLWGERWRALGLYRRANGLVAAREQRGEKIPEPWVLEALLGELGTAYQLGLWDEAAIPLERGLEISPRNPAFKVFRGLLLAETGQGAQAMSHAIRMPALEFRQRTSNSSGFRKRPQGFANQWIKSRVFFQEGNFDGARHALGNLESEWHQRRMPFRRLYWENVGLTMEMVGDGEMIRAYERVPVTLRGLLPVHRKSRGPLILDYPHLAVPYYLNAERWPLGGSPFGYLAELMDRMATAGAENDPLLELLALDQVRTMRARGIPEGLCRAFRGRIYFLRGNTPAALRDLQLAHDWLQSEQKSDGGTSYLLGLAYLLSEQPKKARFHLTEALQLDPENPRVMGHLGVALGRSGAADDALEILNRALALDPGRAESWFNRGVLHFQEARWEQSRQDLERARQLSPDDPRIIMQLQKIQIARRASRSEP